MLRISVWLGVTLLIAVGAIALGNDDFDEGDAQVACNSPAVSRKLESALFTARALSISGTDPICPPPENDDDSDAVMLSRSPVYAERRR
jgi:hypothetical protein